MHTASTENQKITAYIPKHLLQAAQHATGCGITETIRLGLEGITQKNAYNNMLELHGSYKFGHSLDKLREDR